MNGFDDSPEAEFPRCVAAVASNIGYDVPSPAGAPEDLSYALVAVDANVDVQASAYVSDAVKRARGGSHESLSAPSSEPRAAKRVAASLDSVPGMPKAPGDSVVASSSGYGPGSRGPASPFRCPRRRLWPPNSCSFAVSVISLNLMFVDWKCRQHRSSMLRTLPVYGLNN